MTGDVRSWQRWIPWIALAVRVVVAIPLILFAANRLFGLTAMPALERFVAAQLRLLAPDPAAWLALVTGVLLLVGLATRPAVIVLILVVWMRHGPLFRLDVRDAVLVLLFGLSASGGGRASLDGLLPRRARRHGEAAS